MQKIHITKTYNRGIDLVFAVISDHATFLSGGGLKCEMIKQGRTNPNGDGAVRRIVTPKMTFEEKIFDFKTNKYFAYQIISTIPNQPMVHDKGWLNFVEVEGKTRVDWYSNFTITTPVVGGLIGWFVKRQLSNAFLNRLNYIESSL